jgi:hypothetical protein
LQANNLCPFLGRGINALDCLDKIGGRIGAAAHLHEAELDSVGLIGARHNFGNCTGKFCEKQKGREKLYLLSPR